MISCTLKVSVNETRYLLNQWYFAKRIAPKKFKLIILLSHGDTLYILTWIYFYILPILNFISFREIPPQFNLSDMITYTNEFIADSILGAYLFMNIWFRLFSWKGDTMKSNQLNRIFRSIPRFYLSHLDDDGEPLVRYSPSRSGFAFKYDLRVELSDGFDFRVDFLPDYC